jgi:hypothetical protein
MKLVGEEDDMRRKTFRRSGTSWKGSGLGPEEERRWAGSGCREERGRWARERGRLRLERLGFGF